MAVNQYSYFLLACVVTQTKSAAIHFNMPEINETGVNMRSHLKYDNVWEYCTKRDIACKSNNTNICAVKMVNQTRYYKDFVNGCYLFLSNMCDHPEEEYYIITSGTCEEHLGKRRNDEGAEQNDTLVPDTEITNDTDDVTFGESKTDLGVLRNEPKPFSPLYEVEDAFDGHLCPYSCPDTYSPTCITVNRGHGKHVKFFTFVNHCLGDLYYCKNPEEFDPPPLSDSEEEDERPLVVQDSPLSWSYCAAYRFLSFARFSETLSSMGHYGWLSGDYRYSRILTPEQKAKG